MERPLIQVGYHKGEIDFRISGEVHDLSFEQMTSFRSMICVAIGTMEDMFRRHQQSMNKASKDSQ